MCIIPLRIDRIQGLFMFMLFIPHTSLNCGYHSTTLLFSEYREVFYSLRLVEMVTNLGNLFLSQALGALTQLVWARGMFI